RVLNLFAYTGSFSVYAAAGGAAHVTTVDLSDKYCAWAADNLALNRLPRGTIVAEDARTFLRGASEQFDVVILDPPTISKSKRADADFDVQRDHAEFIELALKRLTRGGVLWFSTNFQRFELAKVISGSIAEITDRTVPIDFSHRPHVHRSFRIAK